MENAFLMGTFPHSHLNKLAGSLGTSVGKLIQFRK